MLMCFLPPRVVDTTLRFAFIRVFRHFVITCLQFFASFLRMHGKTYDFKIPYENISRIFMLPKPDQQHAFTILALDPALKQGTARYPFLVMQV